MTFLLVCADATGMAAAADSWTVFADGTPERTTQAKVTSILDRYVVATAGTEYVLDTKRFDPNLHMHGHLAPDQDYPERPRAAYLPHHLRGESSVVEVARRFEAVQEPEVWRREQAVPDVDSFHEALIDMLLEKYEHERRPEWGHRIVVDGPQMVIVISLGFTPDGEALCCRTDIHLTPQTVKPHHRHLVFDLTALEDGGWASFEVANEATGWQQTFDEQLQAARDRRHPQPLGRAAIDTVQAAIDSHDPRTGIEIGGVAHGAQVTPAEAAPVRAK